MKVTILISGYVAKSNYLINWYESFNKILNRNFNENSNRNIDISFEQNLNENINENPVKNVFKCNSIGFFVQSEAKISCSHQNSQELNYDSDIHGHKMKGKIYKITIYLKWYFFNNFLKLRIYIIFSAKPYMTIFFICYILNNSNKCQITVLFVFHVLVVINIYLLHFIYCTYE